MYAPIIRNNTEMISGKYQYNDMAILSNCFSENLVMCNCTHLTKNYKVTNSFDFASMKNCINAMHTSEIIVGFSLDIQFNSTD